MGLQPVSRLYSNISKKKKNKNKKSKKEGVCVRKDLYTYMYIRSNHIKLLIIPFEEEKNNVNTTSN